MNEVDWLLLENRLQLIERSIEMLAALFPPVNVKLEPDVDYVLYEGSLVDPSEVQRWRKDNV